MKQIINIDYDVHNGIEHFYIPGELTYDCDLTIFTFLKDILKKFIRQSDCIPDSYMKIYKDEATARETFQRDVRELSNDFDALREQCYEEYRSQYSDEFKLKVSAAFAKLQLLLPHLWC